MASFQDLFRPIGFDAGPAQQFSQELTQLAIDLASFNNETEPDVVEDLQAALTGSSEVMKKYGVIVNEAAVKQELLNQSLDPSSASEVQKVQARLAIIMRGTSAAQGDAARTAGSFVNQMRSLGGAVKDASVAFGKALLPVVTPLVSAFRGVAEVIRNLVEAFPVLATVTAALAVVVSALGLAVTAVGVAFGFVLSPIGLATLAMRALGISMRDVTVAALSAIGPVASLSFAVSQLGAVARVTFGVLRSIAFTPLGIAITAITVGISLLAAAAGSARPGLEGLEKDLRSIAEVAESASFRIGLVDELEELSSKSQLTAREVERVNAILNTLQLSQETAGIAIDKTGERVNAQADAFDKLRNAIAGAAQSEGEAGLAREVATLADLEKQLAAAERAAERGGQGKIARGRRASRLRDQVAEQKQLIADLRKQIGDLPEVGEIGATGEIFSEDDLKQREQLEKQFRSQRRDAEIAAIEDERARRIAQVREQESRDVAAAQRIGARIADVQARAATEVATINREIDQRLAEEREREEQRNAEKLANEQRRAAEQVARRKSDIERQAAESLRDAQIEAIEDERQRAIAAAEERAKREIELAEEVGAEKKSIEQRLAVEKANINREFDARDRKQSDRDAEREQRRSRTAQRNVAVRGQLASSTAALSFAFGGVDDLQRDQLSVARRQERHLANIDRRIGQRGGIPGV